MKETQRLIIVLTIISFLAGIILAFTYNVTNDKIIQNAENKKRNAIAEVLPGLASYEIQQKGAVSYYQGYDANKNPIGIAYEAAGSGFQGEIRLIMGIDTNADKIVAIKILSQLETPGLGARISEKSFTANYENKPIGDYNVVKRPRANDLEVQAISGATISTVAVTDIIEKALTSLKEAFGGEL